MNDEFNVLFYTTDEEKKRRSKMAELLRNCPIPDEELLDNLALFINSKYLSRMKFMDYLYQQIVNVPGVVMEFGTRWGQNAAHFSALRGIYEPFNRYRKIIAFDTFEGFPGVSDKDGKSKLMEEGALSVSKDYYDCLDGIMDFHEKENPISHLKKYELVKGDVVETLPLYLRKNPETVIALAYFDLDLYEPTRACLKEIRRHLVKGSIVGFDELCDHDSPGETLALMEVFGLNNVSMKRLSYTSRTSYFVVE